MIDRRDYAALDWLAGEIAVNLSQCSAVLLDFQRHPENDLALEEVKGLLRQAQGSLRMLEFCGAQRLLGEMAECVDSLVDERVGEIIRGRQLAALLTLCEEIPAYLHRVQRSRRELPASLIIMFNELRAICHRPLLSSTLLFKPDIPAALNYLSPPDDLTEARFLELSGKLLQMYRLAHAAWLRGEELEKSIAYMAKVAGRLSRLCAGSPQESLWLASAAFFEAMARDGIANGFAVDAIIARLQTALQALAQHGLPEQTGSVELSSLTRDVLFYVACARAETRLISEVQRRFALDKVIAERGGAGESHDALERVAKAIAQELDRCADQLEAGAQNLDLSESSDAVAVLGPSESVYALEALTPLLVGPLSEQQRDDAVKTLRRLGQAIAGGELLPVLDNSTAELAQRERAIQLASTHGREVLSRAQELLLSYVEAQFNVELLQALPGQLRELAADLGAVSLKRPAEVLLQCCNYLEQQLLPGSISPAWEALDGLADAISAVDYYLERSISAPDMEDEALMRVAEHCVASLGYPVATSTNSAEVLEWPAGEATAADDSAAAIDVVTEAVPADDGEHAPSVGDASADSAEAAPELDLDPEILEVFLEEAGEVLDALGDGLPMLRDDLQNPAILADVRRAFHTLKGSGRMVQADALGELAWSVENLLNRVIEGRFELDLPRLTLMDEVLAQLPAMLIEFQQGRGSEPGAAARALMARGEAFAREQSPENAISASSAPEAPAPENVSAEVATDSPAVEAAAVERAATDSVTTDNADDSLLGVFVAEAETHLQVLEQFLAEVESYPVELSDELQRALHTLKGASNMAGVWAIANLITPLEGLVKELRAMMAPAEESLVLLMADIIGCTRELTETLRSHPETALRTPADLLQRLEELSRELLSRAEMQAHAAVEGRIAPGVLSSFLSSFGDELGELVDLLDRADGIEAETLQHTANGLGRFAYRAEEIGLQAVAELAQVLQVLLGRAEDPVPASMISLAACAAERLMDQLNQIAAQQSPDEDPALLALLRDFDPRSPENPGSASPKSEVPPSDPPPQSWSAGAGTFRSPVMTSAVSPAAAKQTASPLPGSAAGDVELIIRDEDVDEEILQIFLEEAADLLEGIDQAIASWSEDHSDAASLETLQRHLHTLKGGGRLAGLTTLGDLCHEFETQITQSQLDPKRDNHAFAVQLNQLQDRLVRMVELAANPVASVPAAPTSTSEDEVEAEGSALQKFDFSAEFAAPAAPREQPLLVEGDEAPTPVALRGPQEMIKVSSQLMERLINLAGETSISRARSEEQVSDIHGSLEEMKITVERLQDQVRRLEMETEAQILFRQEQVGSEGADGFDPLEFDRYSQLQQYSRSLTEAASDLVDLRSTLLDKSRDMESLLQQQSRIHSDLQEGLMRSQMVSFSRMVPRLRRGARQVSAELGKKVDFKVYNADGEMDRRVLERVIPALEHMLRNAIGHGIEDEATRVAAGKSATGEVAMRFDRQGGDVVIAISDDGGGINLTAVRNKAVSLGLISEDAVLSDRQVLDYIFHSGFSTASSLTQISGRGVGMDVVRSEIKQLGGTIDIRTEAGKGTRFEVRLPFTVSVNRALMVTVAGEVYAVPLNNIEGIVRLSPYELAEYYNNPAVQFEYAGQPYNLRYLGQLVGHSQPHLDGQVDLKPVMLIRNAEPPTAVQVDGLMGSREVVVKSLGPQFASVPALSGATIMGDGRVVVILDVLASISADLARRMLTGDQNSLPAAVASTNPLVMVVDDSVTVRKVTSRLLERQQIDVLLARDGMDAVTLLQDIERVPDVILLDIEMPRMDGFEVLVRLKGNPRTEPIPVIMISSRTGEKHRERASGLGVERFLGKPYQESQLLAAIKSLVTVTP